MHFGNEKDKTILKNSQRLSLKIGPTWNSARAARKFSWKVMSRFVSEHALKVVSVQATVIVRMVPLRTRSPPGERVLARQHLEAAVRDFTLRIVCARTIHLIDGPNFAPVC